MKKTLIALMALAGVAVGDTTWTFDGNLNTSGTSINTSATKRESYTEEQTNTETGAVTTVTKYRRANATAQYTESGLVTGTAFGNYVLDADLGQAIDLRNTGDTADTWLSQNSVNYVSGNNKFALTSTVTQDGQTTVTTGTDFTIMAYVNFASTTGEQFIFGTGSGNAAGLAFGIKGGKLDLLAKGVHHHELTSMTALEADVWYHLAVSYDASEDTATFFVNGDKAGSLTLGRAYNAPGNNIGGAIGAASQDLVNDPGIVQGPLDAQIAELKVFNSALGQSTVLTEAHLVPEPATATLSLLALAGLAARRRRK